MSHESRINEALRHLGEEHRLGMIKIEEFRNRRRALFASWGERDATTSPGRASHKSMTDTQTNPALHRPEQPAPGKKRPTAVIVLLVTLAVGAAAVAGWKWKRSPAVPGASSASAAPVTSRSPQLLAVMREANAFRGRNRWDAEDTEAFLARWRGLSAQERRQAQQEPSLQSLRYELEQTIKAERQAMELGPTPEGQARLDRLAAFAQELTGDGS